MTERARRHYLGQGLYFPYQVGQYGRLNWATDVRLIQQSIYSILSTPLGSRFFLREYGSNIEGVLFEPNDAVLIALLDEFIGEALERWEPRIRLMDIGYEFEESGLVFCQMATEILASSQLANFEYSFKRGVTA